MTVGEAQGALETYGPDVLWSLEIRGNHRDYGPPWGPLGWGRWPNRYLELIRMLDDTERAVRNEVKRAPSQ